MGNNFSVLNTLPMKYIFRIKSLIVVIFSTRKVILGRNGQKLTKIVKRRGDFIIVSTVFLPNGPFLLTKYPYNLKQGKKVFQSNSGPVLSKLACVYLLLFAFICAEQTDLKSSYSWRLQFTAADRRKN